MGGPKPPCDCHKAQNRSEELLLELISERLLKYKPTSSDEPPTERVTGYDEGWWECYQQLCDIIDAHTEGNEHRIFQ